MRTADEVPPHDERLGERLATQEEQARVHRRLQDHVGPAVSQVQQRSGRQRSAGDPGGARDLGAAGHGEHRVLEGGIERQPRDGARRQQDLGPDQRRVHLSG
ncbi:hypothetical protein GCM10009835_44450 [Planosporangium flavigriseum]|uniref:Uncharacterized protein n=1 Tax=Planosporangium flavigriseum TaxID=373681 RepID=A0A8J3PJY1_9ACTN|nr:hypothetical protein Pfl04_00180 [Planosporangium flavigriseum]